MAENNFHIIALVAIVAVVGIVTVIQYTGITGAFGFEKSDVCRIDSCPDAVEGVCDTGRERGAVMDNINDIRFDCGLGGPVTFNKVTFNNIKSLCNDFGTEGAVFKVCSQGEYPGRCLTDADCDDENPCTDDVCGFRGCIHGIPTGPEPCHINGQLGECEGDTCVPDCDQDNDGWDGSFQCAAQPDCDDNNPNVNPDAAEVCNGIDDDCDGLFDDVFDPITGFPIC